MSMRQCISDGCRLKWKERYDLKAKHRVLASNDQVLLLLPIKESTKITLVLYVHRASDQLILQHVRGEGTLLSRAAVRAEHPRTPPGRPLRDRTSHTQHQGRIRQRWQGLQRFLQRWGQYRDPSSIRQTVDKWDTFGIILWGILKIKNNLPVVVSFFFIKRLIWLTEQWYQNKKRFCCCLAWRDLYRTHFFTSKTNIVVLK